MQVSENIITRRESYLGTSPWVGWVESTIESVLFELSVSIQI